MAIADRPLDQIVEMDVQALVDAKASESDTLDFKLELPGRSEKDIVGLAADVAAFANTKGGDIVYGMDEEEGVATELFGVPAEGLDRAILRLDEIINSRVKPTVHSLRFHPVTLASGRIAVVLRIPRSWNGPHAMINGDWLRFVVRRSRNNATLNVGEVHEASRRSARAIERKRAFRAERIAKVIANETPVILPPWPKLAFHLMPLTITDSGERIDLERFRQAGIYWHSAHPLGIVSTHVRYNFDGLLRQGDESSTYQPSAYVQFFRDGTLESVSAYSLQDRSSSAKLIASDLFERSLITGLGTYLRLYQAINMPLPLVMMVTLTGVEGYSIQLPPGSNFVEVGELFDRDILVVPEVIIDSYQHEANPSVILRPCFDAVWNASGWSRSMNYDANGAWRGGASR